MANYDVIVIGAGPGGYVAAIRAAQLGLKVLIIEKEHIGGICLNWGCIPTKALLKSAEVYNFCKKAETFGIKISKLDFDFKKIIKRSREVANQLAGGIQYLLKKNKVEILMGTAKLLGNGKVEVSGTDKKIVEAKNIILATGAKPKFLPGLEADGKVVWDYKSAMIADSMPKKLLIIGSGAIGIEFASFYNTFGVDVTVVEVQDRILLTEDKEISQLAQKSFENQGIKFLLQTTANIKKITKNAIVSLKAANSKTEDKEFDKVIVAIGIVPNTVDIGLENTKAKLDPKGLVITNEHMLTDEPGLYAIGDICAGPWLAHKASHEGIIAAETISGKKSHGLRKNMIPGCVYSHPQIASIGLTEEQANSQGFKLKIGRFPLTANGKAVAVGDEGLIKTIFDEKTGELLGAHMIGGDVTEMISTFAMSKNLEATEEEIISTIFPHPTISEAMHESVLAAFNRAIHI